MPQPQIPDADYTDRAVFVFGPPMTPGGNPVIVANFSHPNGDKPRGQGKGWDKPLAPGKAVEERKYINAVVLPKITVTEGFHAALKEALEGDDRIGARSGRGNMSWEYVETHEGARARYDELYSRIGQ